MQSGKELIDTALHGGIPERIPVSIVSTAWIFNNYGQDLALVDRDGAQMAKSWLAFNRDFGADSVCPMLSPMLIPEYYGSKMRIPQGGFPLLVKPAIQEPADLDKLEAFDLAGAPRVAAAVDCVKRLVKEVGSTTFIWLVCIGPISTLSRLMDTQLIMECLVEDPGFIERAFEFSVEVFKTTMEPLIESGVDAIDFSDPVASPDMVSPRMYKRFFWKHDREVAKWIQSKGVHAIYHICGNVLRIIEEMQNTTARGLSVDAPLDLAQARDRVPDATLIGNVDPANIVMNGTPDTVMAACQEAMIQGGPNGRFILAPGCDVPPTSPSKNIDAMIRAAKQFKY